MNLQELLVVASLTIPLALFLAITLIAIYAIVRKAIRDELRRR